MKHVSRVALSVLAFLFFVSAMGILPTSARAKKGPQASQTPAVETQSVSGKVSSVDKSSFTISVTSSAATKEAKQFTGTNGGPKSMTFQIDKNTTVDGQLQVGANADVTYRQDHGTNVAISVHVVA